MITQRLLPFLCLLVLAASAAAQRFGNRSRRLSSPGFSDEDRHLKGKDINVYSSPPEESDWSLSPSEGISPGNRRELRFLKKKSGKGKKTGNNRNGGSGSISGGGKKGKKSAKGKKKSSSAPTTAPTIGKTQSPTTRPTDPNVRAGRVFNDDLVD